MRRIILAILVLLTSGKMLHGETVVYTAAVGELIQVGSSTEAGILNTTLFVSNKEGRYTIIMVGTKPRTVVVYVTGSLPNNLDATISRLYSLVKSPHKKATALKMAMACESVDGNTVAEVLTDFKKLRLTALGDDRIVWSPFLGGLEKYFDDLHDENRDTAEDYIKTLVSIGKSLRRVSQ